MSKGQRGNKEAKKPKAVPAPALPEVVTGLAPLARHSAAKPPKKR